MKIVVILKVKISSNENKFIAFGAPVYVRCDNIFIPFKHNKCIKHCCLLLNNKV